MVEKGRAAVCDVEATQREPTLSGIYQADCLQRDLVQLVLVLSVCSHEISEHVISFAVCFAATYEYTENGNIKMWLKFTQTDRF